MKGTVVVFTLTATFFSQYSLAKAKIPIPYGRTDKIIKIVDLPDQEEFQLEDGRYFDIGSYYAINHIAWLAYSNSEPQLVGYLDDSDEYLTLTPEELEQIASIANIDIPEKANVSFMHGFGGKIILGSIGLIAAYGIYSSYFSKDEEEEQTESAQIT